MDSLDRMIEQIYDFAPDLMPLEFTARLVRIYLQREDAKEKRRKDFASSAVVGVQDHACNTRGCRLGGEK